MKLRFWQRSGQMNARHSTSCVKPQTGPHGFSKVGTSVMSIDVAIVMNAATEVIQLFLLG